MKTLAKIAIGAAVIGLAFATGGASLVPTISATAGGTALGGLVIATGTALSTTALGAIALTMGASLAISGLAQAVQGSPKTTSAQSQRLALSINPKAPRTQVFGRTAMNLDIRYQVYSGDSQDICDIIVALASHKVDEVEELWINAEQAWTATGGIVAKYLGYLGVEFYTEGGPNIGPTLDGWNPATDRLTGCAYGRLRFRLSGSGKKAESPFAGGVPSQIRIIGKGAPLYDPRHDSTVAGGSGPMRANDQSTWGFRDPDGTEIGNNLPLQILRELLGWSIADPAAGTPTLAVGCGLPPKRLALETWITAANLADEQVTITGGGTEPRYHGGGTANEADDPSTVLDMLCAACNGKIVELGGKLGLVIAHNDLALASSDYGLDTDDVIGDFIWNPDPSLEQTPNVISGHYTDPSSSSLYQSVPFNDVRLPSPIGIDNVLPFDLLAVESPSHADRVASQVFERKQYARTFTAPFDIRAWIYGVGDVVPFTFAPLGFNRRLFRVTDQELGQDGSCNMTLQEENVAIYAWDGGQGAVVTAAEPIIYNTLNSPIIQGIAEAGTTAEWPDITGAGKPADNATVGAPSGTPVGDKTADAVAAAVDQIGEIERNVQDLQDTFGDTAAAAASAQAANDAKNAAGGYAQNASDSANAAATYSQISAQSNPLALDLNSGFAQWPDPGQLPTYWQPWENGTVRRESGQQGRSYAMAFDPGTNENRGAFQQVGATFGSYVIEVTGRATDWMGSGVYITWFKSDGTPLGDMRINFAAEKDNAKWISGADGGGGTYQRTWSRLFTTGIDGRVSYFIIYAMANWQGFEGAASPSGPVTRNAKSINFDGVVFRKALQPEIDAGDALTGLDSKASISYAQQVAADAQGNAIAASQNYYNSRYGADFDATFQDRINTAAGPAGAVATRTSTLEANFRSGYTWNMVKNSDFSDGFNYWNVNGGFWTTQVDAGVGPFVAHSPGNGNPLFQDIPCYAEHNFVLSYEGNTRQVGNPGASGIRVQWCGPGGFISDGVFLSLNGTVDDGWGGRISAFAGTSPPGTTFARLLLFSQDYFDATRIQFQEGTVATQYRNDGDRVGSNALITVAQGVANDARGRTSAFYSITADAGGGVAAVTVYADGFGAGVLLGGNVFIHGNLMVDGEIATRSITNGAISATHTALFAGTANIGEGDNESVGATTVPVSGDGPAGVFALVQFQAFRSGGRATGALVALQRDGNTVGSTRVQSSGSGYGIQQTFFALDNPTGGNHVYGVQVYVDDTGTGLGAGWIISDPQVIFMEFRR